MAAEGLQRARVLRVAQLVARGHQDDLVLVALVVARGSTLHDIEGRVLTYEGHLAVGARYLCRRSAADGHVGEYGVLDVARLRVGIVIAISLGPLDNIRYACCDSGGFGELQRQRAVIKTRATG